MNDKQEELKFLSEVERRLASDRPFGDYRYIDGQTWLHYESRLKMLAEHVPAAGQTLKAFAQASGPSRYRVMGDPVVRSAINTGLSYFKLSGPEVNLEEIAGVLQVATRQLRANSRISPLSLGVAEPKRLGRSLHHGWIWKDEREEDFPAKSFRGLFFRQESGRSALWTPDKPAHQMLLQGTQLLTELLPKLSRSVLNHVHLVVLLHVADRELWKDERHCLPFDSFSTGIVPGTIFLSKTAIKDTWRTAEYLLHEALHQKHHDLEHTHSMLREGYAAQYSPTITALWNRTQGDNLNEWPVCRTVAAFHVYVHLSLFFKVLAIRSQELEDSYDLHNVNATLYARRSLDRAHYLGKKLQEVSNEMGLAGNRFIEWLLEALVMLDPEPSLASMNNHLLDLYESETEQIGKMVANWGKLRSKFIHKTLAGAKNNRPARQAVLDLVEGDLALADQLPLVLNGNEPYRASPLPSFRPDAIGEIPDEQLASLVSAARNYTYSALRSANPMVFNSISPVQPAKTVGQLLEERVARSGECLNTFEYSPD